MFFVLAVYSLYKSVHAVCSLYKSVHAVCSLYKSVHAVCSLYKSVHAVCSLYESVTCLQQLLHDFHFLFQYYRVSPNPTEMSRNKMQGLPLASDKTAMPLEV